MKIEYNFKNDKITVNLVKSNLRKEVANFIGISEDEITNSLVRYDPTTNTVTVDEQATDTYAKYAAIHECICCGSYDYLAPKTDSPDKRCGLIDKMLVELMPELERKEYIEKRIEMFETLVKYNLNPELNEQFRESTKLLKTL